MFWKKQWRIYITSSIIRNTGNEASGYNVGDMIIYIKCNIISLSFKVNADWILRFYQDLILERQQEYHGSINIQGSDLLRTEFQKSMLVNPEEEYIFPEWIANKPEYIRSKSLQELLYKLHNRLIDFDEFQKQIQEIK